MQNILVDCNTAELVHIDLGKKGRAKEGVTVLSLIVLHDYSSVLPKLSTCVVSCWQS